MKVDTTVTLTLEQLAALGAAAIRDLPEAPAADLVWDCQNGGWVRSEDLA
jgi:hypothetical protein